MQRTRIATQEPPMRSISAIVVLLCCLVSGSAHAEDPATFERELAHLRRLVACDTRVTAEVTPPEGLRLKSVDSSCKKVRTQIERFRKRWLDKARPFLAEIVPSDISKTIVYPFGGADLLTALTTFPDLTLVTTMSLEWVGDPRAILKLESSDLRRNLGQQHAFLIKLFQVNHNRTVDLQELNHSPIPAPLVFALTALDLLGYEPLEARWFRLESDGRVHYLTPSEIAAFDESADGKKQKDRNEFFSNVELTFRKADDPAAPVQSWRHMRTNLHDDHLKGSPTIAYLESLGPITGMTKAASYLLTFDQFDTMRKYIVDHVDWMVSDSTGLPPKYGTPAGFEYETYGTYEKSNMTAGATVTPAWREQYKAQPKRELKFRFGYPDGKFRGHLIIMRKTPSK
jgi:hypothetical protein